MVNMTLFSDRYGYTKPSDVLIRETITREVENTLCSCYDYLYDYFRKHVSYNDDTYEEMELFLWTNFLNERRNDFYNDYGGHIVVATRFLKDKDREWFSKLNMVELSVKWLFAVSANNLRLAEIAKDFTTLINNEFERLNYAYRFVDKEIVELANDQEIKAIEECLATNAANVKMHLSNALELLSRRPMGKYSNSIKESISAVEVVCRDKTGAKDLGRALDCLIKKGIVIPQPLKSAFSKLYDYTNDKETGIRHALMDESGNCVPTYAEALFMLVSCSAFINYLNAKEAKQ